jgi:hypothetical protein
MAQGSGAVGQRSAGQPAGSASKWTLATRLAVALTIALVISYLLLWASAVQGFGGPEGYVRRTDFVSTLTGSLVLREGNGHNLYDLEVQRDAQSRILSPYVVLDPGRMLPYNHIPFEAILITPFIDLPYPLIFALWTLAAGLAIGLALGMMDGALPVARPIGWVLSLAACSYLPLIRSLMLGQNSPFVLLGLCATFVALRWGQPVWAGASLLLVALKPQVLPVVLLLLLLQRQWKAILTFAVLMSAFSVLAMPILGIDWPLKYAQLLLGVAGWNDPNAINPAIMHNWRGFATNLFEGWLPGLITPAYVLLSLASVGLIAWAWLHTRDAASTGEDALTPRPQSDLLWALSGILAVLISPHLNPHDLTLLIFPAWIIGAYAASGFWSAANSRIWFAILWTGYALGPVVQVSDTGAVLPSVLLMATAALLLVRQLTAQPSAATRPLSPAT